MTRGLYPPDTLTKDDVVTLAKVRQDIWSNGLIGGGFGAGSGLVLHTGAQWARRFGLINPKLNRNTLMLSVLAGGSLGMFLFATSRGKEEVHNLHDIFQVGATPRDKVTRPDYQTMVKKSKKEMESEIDLEKMQEIRLTRRRSLMDSLQRGHGISDAHGGHWYKEGDK